MSASRTANVQPIPYLSFDGTCAEAMRFYESVLGGTIKVMMKGSETPMAEHIPAEFADRIMNAQLELPGGNFLYAGDAPAHIPFEGMRGCMVTLNYDTVEEAEAIFDALAAGGQVTMPFAPTFWAVKFGMCVDKYGTSWAVNGQLTPMA
ncbi:MAG: VOC family protein [Planctomycetales bacterium]|nr:VOC family protein [Planctomycetales bacterium]MCA9167273.1 VOC family protein [Planctomycetales bacterium]